MMKPARPIALVGLALTLLAGSPGVGTSLVRAAGPSVAITVPAPGATLVAGPLLRLGWSESAPAGAPIVARTVIQYSGAVTENRTCPRYSVVGRATMTSRLRATVDHGTP